MRRKKIAAVSVTLAGIMAAAGVMSGCSLSGGDNGKIRIEMIQYKQEAVGVFEELEKKFNETHDDIELVIDSPNDATTIMKTRFIREDYPDIIGIGGDMNYSNFLDAGLLMDISDYEGLDSIKQAYLDMDKELELVPQEGVYAVPYAANAAGVLYNKDIFDEHGWEIPTTWDEFFELGQQAKADGRALFTYPQSGYFDATIYAMLAQAGGIDFYNNALTYDADTWTSAEGKKVLDTVAQLVSSDNIWADTVANANTDGGFKINQQAVIDGEALFMPNGSWVVGEMANTTPSDYEWGVMGVPKWSADEDQAVYTFTEQMWIPADAANIDLAKEFIKFMYSDTVVDLCLANKTTNAETGEESDSPIVVPVKGAADKLPDGVIKSSFQTGDDVVAVTGTWATTAPIEGLDMKGSVYGPIDSISNGAMTVDEWQKQLVDVWKQCANAME